MTPVNTATPATSATRMRMRSRRIENPRVGGACERMAFTDDVVASFGVRHAVDGDCLDVGGELVGGQVADRTGELRRDICHVRWRRQRARCTALTADLAVDPEPPGLVGRHPQDRPVETRCARASWAAR